MLFRVDADKRLGVGHLSRCVELAKKLKKFNVSSHFLIKNNEYAIGLIRRAGFSFNVLTKINDEKELSLLIKLHNKIKFDCLFIDLKKNKNKKFFLKLRRICKTVVIDNTNRDSLYADLIIWPWVKEQYSKTIILKNSQKILVGTKYMMLGHIKKNRNKNRLDAILISMGGSDKRGLTLKIIRSLKKTTTKFHADIVIGGLFTNAEKILTAVKDDKRFSIIKNNVGLIPIMSNYRIGIFTFGITTFEAFYVGLPSIVLSHSNENHIYAKKTTFYNCMQYLGNYRNVNFNKLPQVVFDLMQNLALRKKYARNGQYLVDGKGSERVAKRIIKLIS